MTIFLGQRFSVSASEVINVAVGFVDRLESGELLNGTPTVAENGTSDFTLANAAVSTGALTILGTSHAIGQAVQFTVTVDANPTSGPHEVILTVTTDASQTIKRGVYFDVE